MIALELLDELDTNCAVYTAVANLEIKGLFWVNNRILRKTSGIIADVAKNGTSYIEFPITCLSDLNLQNKNNNKRRFR